MLRPQDTITHVKFFSAKINLRPNDHGQATRQILYWRALRVNPKTQIIEGYFLSKGAYLPLVASVDSIAVQYNSGVNISNLVPSMAHVYRSEDKGTDVNLAVHLVHGSRLNRFDGAIVISNDSDLAEAIRIVRREVRKPVFVLHPQTSHPSFKLKQVATRFKPITTAHLAARQFRPTLSDSKGTFHKPSSW